jgi:flagellar protein FliO/FliZ
VIELTIRIVFSLFVVIALMVGMAKLARKPLGIRRGGGLIEVLGRQQLSRGASVAVVRIADKAMVLGVTDGQVSLISEADLTTIEEYQPEPQVKREPLSLESLDAAAGNPTADSPATGRPTTGSPVAGRPGGAIAGSPGGALGGSVLSPDTWKQTLQFLRERTVRKS